MQESRVVGGRTIKQNKNIKKQKKVVSTEGFYEGNAIHEDAFEMKSLLFLIYMCIKYFLSIL